MYQYLLGKVSTMFATTNAIMGMYQYLLGKVSTRYDGDDRTNELYQYLLGKVSTTQIAKNPKRKKYSINIY